MNIKSIFKSLITLDLKTLLLMALILVIIFMRMCEHPSPKPTDTININGTNYGIIQHTIDTVLVPYDTIVYRPGKKIYIDTTIYVQIPITIDTIAILKDYYSKKIYIDTLKLTDSLGYIIVNDTISKNSIIGRLWNAKVNKVKITETLIVKELSTNQLYIGLVAGFDKVNIVNFAGPSLILKTKTDNLYSIGIGYSGNKTVSIQGGMYWKIKLKK